MKLVYDGSWVAKPSFLKDFQLGLVFLDRYHPYTLSKPNILED
jgi:hypothetical protein